ncbi:MAG TPA: alcohol dehydrogenase [Acidimicrobiales bacterium]|nr:alcohol dehydrogenase [Acidimicrobiales bacterium]
MLQARLDGADPEFPVSLVEIEPPPLPTGEWARVEVASGGICGSDLAMIRPVGPRSALWGGLIGIPIEMGHEISGTVVEAGDDCDLAVGTLVAVDPIRSCVTRGLDPCPSCRAGVPSTCTRLDDPTHGRGWGHGFGRGVGGGWSQSLVAHHSQLHRVPDGVDATTAALTEPLAVALHGLLRTPLVPAAPTLVIGAGPIGLAAVAALGVLDPDIEVTVVARYRSQARAAEALGAAATVIEPDHESLLEHLAGRVGASVLGGGDNASLKGGFAQTVDTVGNGTTVDLACRVTLARGTVYEIGAPGIVTTDLSMLYRKELQMVGTLCYGHDHGPGGTLHTFDRALAALAAGAFPSEVVVSHRFPLEQVREACETAFDKSTGALKVMLGPN